MCRSDGALILNSYALLQRTRSDGALSLLVFDGIAQLIQTEINIYCINKVLY